VLISKNWLNLPAPKGFLIPLRFNRSDWLWIQNQSPDYIPQVLRYGHCKHALVGEISHHTLSAIPELLNPDTQDLILQDIAKETAVPYWGPEGTTITKFDLSSLSKKRQRDIKILCDSLSLYPNRILKAIILRDKGYIVFDSSIPTRNRIAILKIRELIRNFPLILSNHRFSFLVLYAALSKLKGSIHDWK